MGEFPQDYEVFDLGDVTLQHGATLRDAKLAYKTYGELNADKSNAIVYPTWYSGRHWDNEWLIGDGMALDPAKYFTSSRTCWATGYRARHPTHRRLTTPRASPASLSTIRSSSSISS
jgi:homoserine acetyltransferase